MELSGVFERLERVVATTRSPDAEPVDIKAALKATVEVQSYVDALRAELVHALDAHPTAFPEAAIAETSGCTLGAATKERERAKTLDSAAAMALAMASSARSFRAVCATDSTDAAALAALPIARTFSRTCVWSVTSLSFSATLSCSYSTVAMPRTLRVIITDRQRHDFSCNSSIRIAI